jgi:DNA-binding GntR family transcriptional regulator
VLGDGKVGGPLQEVPLIRDQVYQLLLEEVIGGRLRPGDRITERETAARLGISTTPVKEALRRLENEGFVRTLPRRGVVVSETALTSVGDVIAVRAALESLAARLAAERFAAGAVGAEARQRLEDSVAALAGIDTADVPDVVALNTAFHDTVRELSANRVVVQLVGLLLGVDAAVRRQALSEPDELRRGVAEHRQVGEAILAGQPDEAERSMREHSLRAGSHTIGGQR